jgi:hypothetical protein
MVTSLQRLEMSFWIIRASLVFEFLPLFPIHGEPVAGDFQVEVTVTDGGLL